MGSHEICDCRECTAQDQERLSWRWFIACVGVACLMAWLMGCMTITISDSVLVNSSVSMDKPIRAGVSTTGEAIGEAIKAAGWGGPVDIEAIQSVLEEYRKIRAQSQRQ